MPVFNKINSGGVVENIEVWERAPSLDGYTFVVGNGHIGWSYDASTNTFSPPVAPTKTLDQQKKDLITKLADERYQKETAGITLNGAPVLTDRASQAMIMGAYNMAKENPAIQITFKGVLGWETIDAPHMIAIAVSVGDYVQKCFAREKAFNDQILAAPDFATFNAIDITSGWPSPQYNA